MRVGIASSMWRGLADLPFSEYLAYCRQADADVIELSGWESSYSGTLRLDAVGAQQVFEATSRAELSVVAIGSPDDFVQPMPERLDEQVRNVQRLVDFAGQIGAGVVALKVGTPKEGIAHEDAVGLIVEGLRRIAPYAKERKVFLALENRTTITNDVEMTHHQTWQHARLVLPEEASPSG